MATGDGLLCLDRDPFKAFNASGEHLAGDEPLRQLAVLLREPVARRGVDEFAMLLNNFTLEDARHLAEKIHPR